MKLGLRRPTPTVDEFAGLDRLDRRELDDDFEPPSTPERLRVA